MSNELDCFHKLPLSHKTHYTFDSDPRSTRKQMDRNRQVIGRAHSQRHQEPLELFHEAQGGGISQEQIRGGWRGARCY
jgi:hypothetical protein